MGFWPVVVIVAVAIGNVGMSAELEPSEGYATQEECQARLPNLLVQASTFPWPVQEGMELSFTPACVDIHPADFFEKYINKAPGQKA